MSHTALIYTNKVITKKGAHYERSLLLQLRLRCVSVHPNLTESELHPNLTELRSIAQFGRTWGQCEHKVSATVNRVYLGCIWGACAKDCRTLPRRTIPLRTLPLYEEAGD